MMTRRQIRKLIDTYGIEKVKSMSPYEQIDAYEKIVDSNRKRTNHNGYEQLTLKELYPEAMEEKK